MTLIPHLELEGTRITTLADRLGISKQAVGQLVDDLEELGVVSRTSDPEDGRAKLVRFTDRGRVGLLEGLALLAELEQELELVVGASALQSTGRTLRRILAHLSVPEESSPNAEADGGQ